MIQVDIIQLIPAFLRNDRNGYAMAKAIEAGMRYFCRVVAESTDGAINVDAMPQWRMDEAAWAMNIEWWDRDYTTEEKRNTLKESGNVYRSLGTKTAVEKAISSIFEGTRVSEWWEYGGEPYHFRLLLDSTYENVDAEKHRKVLGRIECFKNLRSVLDDVEYYDLGGSAAAYTGTVFVGAEITDGATAFRY